MRGKGRQGGGWMRDGRRKKKINTKKSRAATRCLILKCEEKLLMIWLGHSKIWRTETVLNDWEKQERIEGGRRGGGGCVLGGRDLLWEETRTEGAGKQKLGHMEKSSCNDPTLGPAHSSHVCLSSCLSVHHLWSSVKLLCPSSSPETAAVCLHLYVFDCFSSLASLMDPVLPPVSEINRLITSPRK